METFVAGNDEYLDAIALIPNAALIEVAKTEIDDLLCQLKTAGGETFYISWEVAREELESRGVDWIDDVSN